MSSRQWVQCSGKCGQWSEFWWQVSGVKVWQKNGGGEQEHEVWCDGWGKMVLMCCRPCTSGPLVCSRSAGGPAASVAVQLFWAVWRPQIRWGECGAAGVSCCSCSVFEDHFHQFHSMFQQYNSSKIHTPLDPLSFCRLVVPHLTSSFLGWNLLS